MRKKQPLTVPTEQAKVVFDIAVNPVPPRGGSGMSDDVVVLLEGDCVALMAAMEPDSVDAIVCDPPYDLAFMGKSWDSTAVAFSPETWRQALRVLKPGGHLLAFGGTRTVHRMTVAIEDAGFEIRDQLTWGYACLSDDTEVLTRDGWVQYHSASEGQHAAAFDPGTGAIRWESISAVHRYHHEGDMAEVGPSLVTLNHRVVLDSASGRVPCLPGVWSDVHAPVGVGEEGSRTRVLAGVQREASHPGPTLPSGHPGGLDSGVSTLRERPDDGTAEPGLEGRGYRVQEAWELLRGALREGAGVGAPHVPEGRVLHGAPPRDGGGLRVPVVASGGGEPREPRPEGQPVGEPHVVAGQRVSQAVGSGPVHPGDGEPDEPRLVPYAGTVWCITVPSGAFVARRNGVVFVTGNSGFPKSLNVGKAIDKAARGHPQGGADPDSPAHGKYRTQATEGKRSAGDAGRGYGAGPGQFMAEDVVSTDRELVPDAETWAGWGTAMKPAFEPICMARKPLVGTVAQNVQQHGTGALNIDATRIPTQDDLNGGAYTGSGERHDGTENRRFRNGGRSALPGDERTEAGQGMLAPGSTTGREYVQPPGRWPANLILTDPVLDGGMEGVVGGGETSGVSAGVRGRNQFGLINDDGWSPTGAGEPVGYGDSGTYSRFFLIPKANRAEREPDPEAAEAEGLSRPVAYCNCETDKPWIGPQGSASPPRDTSGVGDPMGGSDSTTTLSGSPPTGQSPPGTKSTTETGTSRTTTSETFNSLTPSATSASTEGANSAMVSGGSPADSAVNPSPSTSSTGTSPERGGPSMDGADPATSESSSERNACAVCGLLKPSDGSPTGGGRGVVEPLKRHNDHPT